MVEFPCMKSPSASIKSKEYLSCSSLASDASDLDFLAHSSINGFMLISFFFFLKAVLISYLSELCLVITFDIESYSTAASQHRFSCSPRTLRWLVMCHVTVSPP